MREAPAHEKSTESYQIVIARLLYPTAIDKGKVLINYHAVRKSDIIYVSFGDKAPFNRTVHCEDGYRSRCSVA